MSAKVLDDRHPGGVELRRRGGVWRASPRDTAGLLNKRDRDVLGEGDLGHRPEVSCAYPTASPVTENKRRPRTSYGVEMDTCKTVWGFELKRHVPSSAHAPLSAAQII